MRYARKLEGITQAYPVFGRADVVARAEIRNTAALQTVLDEVNKIEGVTATETLPEVS